VQPGDLVEESAGADQQAFAAGLCRLDTHQGDGVGAVVVEFQFVVAVIATRLGAQGCALVHHVEDVLAFAVLQRNLAEIAADQAKRGTRQLKSPALDRQVREHREAGAVLDVVVGGLQQPGRHRQLGLPESDESWISAAFKHCARGALDLRNHVAIERAAVAVGCGEIGRHPGGLVLDASRAVFVAAHAHGLPRSTSDSASGREFSISDDGRSMFGVLV
jgi:hypothetical protein